MKNEQTLLKARKRALEMYYNLQPGTKHEAVTRRARNVVGVGIGHKGTGDPDRPGVHVYVDRMIGEKTRSPHRIKEPGGILTHIIETGRFHSFQPAGAPGSTIGLDYDAPNINPSAAGTLGAIVKAGTTYYALGSNHVMSVNGRVPQGTKIMFRPPDQYIDDPSKYVFARTKVHVQLDPAAENLVDCALAEIEDGDRVAHQFPERVVVASSNPVKPARGMEVVRVDDIEQSVGTIVDIHARLTLDFSFGTFEFDDQVIIEPKDSNKPFAQRGDSGALIVSLDPKNPGATALVIGGTKTYAVACPLHAVFKKLNGVLKGTPPILLAGVFKGRAAAAVP